jgi:NAD-dependent DNA ligase
LLNKRGDLEYQTKRVMAHRYLYYVLATPVIPDCAYDQLERDVRATAPEDSPVHKVGSSLSWDYPPDVVSLAKSWIVEE